MSEKEVGAGRVPLHLCSTPFPDPAQGTAQGDEDEEEAGGRCQHVVGTMLPSDCFI